jgi:hypothetical protein
MEKLKAGKAVVEKADEGKKNAGRATVRGPSDGGAEKGEKEDRSGVGRERARSEVINLEFNLSSTVACRIGVRFFLHTRFRRTVFAAHFVAGAMQQKNRFRSHR